MAATEERQSTSCGTENRRLRARLAQRGGFSSEAWLIALKICAFSL
jgi:hypothetical protein